MIFFRKHSIKGTYIIKGSNNSPRPQHVRCLLPITQSSLSSRLGTRTRTGTHAHAHTDISTLSPTRNKSTRTDSYLCSHTPHVWSSTLRIPRHDPRLHAIGLPNPARPRTPTGRSAWPSRTSSPLAAARPGRGTPLPRATTTRWPSASSSSTSPTSTTIRRTPRSTTPSRATRSSRPKRRASGSTSRAGSSGTCIPTAYRRVRGPRAPLLVPERI